MRNFGTPGLLSPIGFLFALLVALALAGCGGGGGGGSSSNCPNAFSACTVSSGSTSGSGGTTTAAPTVTVAIVDGSGAATTTLPSSGSVTINATVKDAAGAVVPATVVTFTTNLSLGAFNPPSGTALTNASGVATIQMSAASLSAAGAALVTASAALGTTTVSGTAAYQLGAANVTLTDFSISATDIPAYGTSTISATVRVNGVPTTAPLSVNLSSGCASSGKATLASTVQTVNGVATATYTDKGCNGTDTITVSVLDKTVQGTIKSAGPAPANIQFVSATPETIALKGTAGLIDVSSVVFKVVDASGNAVPSTTVEFYLTNWTGGIKLDDNTKAAVDAMTGGRVRKQTAADGTVTVTVQAGTNPTSIWVLANVLGASLSTQSNKLVISTGLPSQDRFSLAVGVHNIEGWDYDGVTTNLTIYAFDRVGNPVPEGTTVNFVTEGAGTSPAPGVCATASGTCSINFVSANNRPQAETLAVCLDAGGNQVTGTDPSRVASTCVTAGRVSVLAYANGEEGFDDANGNNFFDAGETFRDVGDVFIDNNENGVWDAGVPEQYFPFVAAAGNANAGLACPTPIGYGNARSKANSCNNIWGQAQVRHGQVIILSGSHVQHVYAETSNVTALGGAVGVVDGFGGALTCSTSFAIRLSDVNNNPLPAGTKLGITNNAVTYDQNGSPDPATVVAGFANDTILDTTIPGGTTHVVTMQGTKCNFATKLPKGTLTIQVTTPKGNITAIPVSVN